MLPAFTCASARDNLWDICLGVNVLIHFPLIALYLDSDAIVVQSPNNSITSSLQAKCLLKLANFFMFLIFPPHFLTFFMFHSILFYSPIAFILFSP